jgi:hypothetical protein
MPQFRCYFGSCDLSFPSALSLSNHQRHCCTNATKLLSYQVKKRKARERKQAKARRRAQDNHAAQPVAAERDSPGDDLEGDIDPMTTDPGYIGAAQPAAPDLPENLEQACLY